MMAQPGYPVHQPGRKSNNPLFFTLPPELRIQILELALHPPGDGVDLGRGRSPIARTAKSLFLVSRQMYADAVPIFYRDVRIDLRGHGFDNPSFESTHKFLRVSTIPRQHVRNATVYISMTDCCHCETAAKLELETYLRLRRLTVLIGPDYPYPPYGCSIHPPDRPRHFFDSRLESGDQVTGPACLEGSQFQAFLRFLQRPGLGKVAIKVPRSHLDFFCQFHEPDQGRECRGGWRGPTDWVSLDCEAMMKTLLNVEIDDSVAAEVGCVTYRREAA